MIFLVTGSLAVAVAAYGGTKMSLLAEGSVAPDFTAKNDKGKDVSLHDLKGKNVILYFYPADDTPGCTKEACNFRDDHAKYGAKGAVILGVSTQGVESHTAFKNKYELPFDLLVDTEKNICKLYGVELSVFGSAKRVTFVIGKDGKILKVFPTVAVDNHSKEILGILN